MNNFQNFQQTKIMMTPKEFNKKNNDSVDIYGALYVYKEYFYIHYNRGEEKPFSLTIGNQSYDSHNLESLEIKLYNDWFIENIEGSEEWLPYVGIHSKKQTALYYLIFKDDMGFDVEDISYSNDSVDTLRLSINKIELFDVLLPNSARYDSDKEKFNTFCVFPLECDFKENADYERVGDGTMIDSMEKLHNFFNERFHKLALDYMNRVLALAELDSYESGDYEPCSLDEFLNDNDSMINDNGNCVWDDFPKNKSLQRAYNQTWTDITFEAIVREEGYSILGIWDSYNDLGDAIAFGCEPINMFEDGVESERLTKEIFEKVTKYIEVEIANGSIPLETNWLEFNKLSKYFDTIHLLEECTSDKMCSDVIDLVDDYLEYDCTITWSPNHWDKNGDEIGAFDENGDAKEYTWNGHEYNPLGDTKEYDSEEFTSPSAEDKLELCRLANNHLKARIKVFENEAASMDSEIRNLETKYQASQSEITELETRVTNLSFQYEVLQNKLSNAISPTKHQCTINRLESQISIKDAKIQSQMKKINNLITK
tara:strand:- start:178 stop:1797 length:1620 start_codon:yes stop_codon:yes gene_type:complete